MKLLFSALPCSVILKKGTLNPKLFIHSIKAGIAFVLVSLLYLVDALYKDVGANAMWAMMTVVVVFNFTAGATLSKSFNRSMGTILGGGLGCLAAILAQEIGGIGRAIAVGMSVFIFGAVASYARMVPRIKKKYDYGLMIFILTFNLVVVSGHRSEEIIQFARESLSTIVMGILICIITSLVIFPVWASDELHCSITKKFDYLATSIEGKFCKMGEPWHGKFGLYHPWDKYLRIGELLRELAALNLSLKGWLLSPPQPSLTHLRLSVKEPSEQVALLVVSTTRELGDSIINMTRCTTAELITVKLQSRRLELHVAVSASKPDSRDTGDKLETASLVFRLMQIIIMVENLAIEVEELGDLAGFLPK